MTIIKCVCVCLIVFVGFSGIARADLFADYGFAAAEAEFSVSLKVSDRDARLIGNWKLIASCSKSHKGEFMKKDANGLKNQDRSQARLVFSNSELFSVEMLNLGAQARNQGPVEALFNLEEGFVTFAQLSYRAGKMNDAIYFFSECKFHEANALLCAKRLFVNRPELVNEDQRRLHQKVVGFDFYQRSDEGY